MSEMHDNDDDIRSDQAEDQIMTGDNNRGEQRVNSIDATTTEMIKKNSPVWMRCHKGDEGAPLGRRQFLNETDRELGYGKVNLGVHQQLGDSGATYYSAHVEAAISMLHEAGHATVSQYEDQIS